MPIYKLNGEVYDIPDDVVADFEKDNPSATVTYHAGDDEYEIPVSERDAFLKDFPDARTDSDDLAGKPQGIGDTGKQSKGYTPTAEEMAGFQRTIGQAQQTIAGSQQAARRIDARQKYAKKTNYGLTPPQVKLGQNSKVVETDPHFNPDTGKMESTYITEQGNEYQTREGADIEQNAVDIAKRQMTLPGQLDDAYAERDSLDSEIAALEAKYNGALQENNGFVYHDKNLFTDEDDTRLQTLKAARRQNEQRIIALEAERDDDGGTQFWRGFLDAAKNPSTWSFGISDLDDMRQLWRIKEKVDAGEELTDEEETLLKNTMANGYAQQMFGENRGFMYRAGGISMQALPFVAEFMATGGYGGVAKGVSGTVAKGLAKMTATDLSKKGLRSWLVKNTGVLAGDIASSFIMANTTGAARTGADIMQRHTGQVTMDEEGNYQFEGGKGIGQSIYEGEVASTLEYYTEKLGEHLQLGNWIAKGADKMGLSKLSKAVGYLSNSKMLNAGGIQDYPSEVVEEQANLLLNAILVGDNNFSIDPNSKDFDKSVFNPKTQLDIWGGMLFSIGLMQAPRLAHTGYNAAGYYAYKHTTDVADANAAIVFGEDNWQMIKEQIDNCDNEHLSELLQSVLAGGMNDMQKTATMNYAGNLLKMRGYNNGMMADVRGEAAVVQQQTEQDAESFLSHGIDQGYQQGHEAQEPDDKKMIVDEANAAEARLSDMFTKQDIQFITNTEPMEAINIMLSNRGTNPGEWNDDEIAAVVDYYQKQARAQGVMDAAADDVEYQVAKANAEVDANTHKDLNQMIMAESGGEQFYIVGGDVRLMPDADAPGVVAGPAGETARTVAFDMEGTGDALIVRNVETGEISVKSPQMLSVTLVNDPNQLKMLNETQLRQQLTQQHEDEITFGSPAQEVFQLEDTVTLNDGQGNVIEGEIGMMPASVDGAYVVYTSDGKAMQFTGDELNKMIVAHNGMEVERAAALPHPTVEEKEAELDNAGGEAGAESSIDTEPSATVSEPAGEPAGTVGEKEQPQSALDRIPFLQDESGRPILNRKGKKQYQWHKASVDDTADALTETTGGDMLMARDTATDLINNARGKLEKIRKQKPKGDDPIEIAESRAEIKRQEQEQQAIIKHWQDVNQTIQRRMQEESARRQAEIEAAKSEEQKAREAEEARIRKEKQDEIERQRLREAIEKDRERRNKEYEPLVQARKDMADDSDAMAILQDTEPRDLREWVSSLLRPHSILWQDASDSEVGLRSELGLKRTDMQRFMTLLGNKENGAVPFGKAILDIYEGLPEGMKEQYTDQDVRNVVLDLFQSAANSREMMNLAAENRIAEAKYMRENRMAQEAEWEMEAWAEAYHLTPEERETFEEFMQMPPMAPEQEVINQLIEEYEQSRPSNRLDQRPDNRGVSAEAAGGENQVQQAAEAASNGNYEERIAEGAEADTGEPAVSGDNVAGGAQAESIINPEVDLERMRGIREALTEAYRSGDETAIALAAEQVLMYVDEGLDDYRTYHEAIDDYEGDEPDKLADQYITHVFLDRYVDDDEDQEYIKTGLKPDMRQIAPSEQLKPTDLRDAVRPESAELGVNEANARAREAAGEPQPIGTNRFGGIYNQFKGKVKEAFDFLIKKKDGYLQGVFHRDDIGDIDLAWGSAPTPYTGKGLAHIIRKHIEVMNDFKDIEEAIRIIEDVINNGTAKQNSDPQLIDIEKGDYRVVIAQNAEGNWILSAFDFVRGKKEKVKGKTLPPSKTPGQSDVEAGAVTSNLSLSEDKDTNNSANSQEKSEKSAKYSSFDELKANIPETVTDPAMQKALRKIVDKMFLHGSSNHRSDPRGFEYIFVYMADGTNKSDRGLLKPFALVELEKMREAREPIRLIILKARQWGGSTLSEGYEKWMQDFRHPYGWNIVILAHVQDATKRIKAMFTKMLDFQPGWSLGVKGRRLKLSSYEGSKNDFIVTDKKGEEVGSRVISVGSYERYDSLRSADLKCAHFSEVAYWKKTQEKEPEEVLSSIDGGIPSIADTVEIMESSGRSAAGFFHDMYQEAKDPDIPSAWRAIFIAFFQIENDRKELDTKWGNIWSDKIPWRKVEQDKGYVKLCLEFALWLWENRKSKQCPDGFRETGEFFWSLWEKGASFEAINWYRYRRNAVRSHTYIATEAPSDDVEAFRMSGKLVFDMYRIEALEHHKTQGKKEPAYIGNIVSAYEKGEKAIYTAKFVETVGDGQVLRIWAMPDCLKVSDRYVVSVDIGGRSQTSDFTVMTVIDRLGMMRGMGGKPKVVARWRGHIRHDLLAWKAAALAHFYGDAELVIESNTADTKKNMIDTEGEHSLSIIDEIADYYDNLYIRETRVDEVTQKVTNVYGFQTNVLTKQLVIDNYIAYIDDQLYYEPDKQCYDELRIYERHDDGTLGNVEGQNNHDDIVMSTGIGLYVSQKMPLPAWKTRRKATAYGETPCTEADV